MNERIKSRIRIVKAPAKFRRDKLKIKIDEKKNKKQLCSNASHIVHRHRRCRCRRRRRQPYASTSVFEQMKCQLNHKSNSIAILEFFFTISLNLFRSCSS